MPLHAIDPPVFYSESNQTEKKLLMHGVVTKGNIPTVNIKCVKFVNMVTFIAREQDF
jgi:hypothetical protein